MILVIYINVSGIRLVDIEDYVMQVTAKIKPITFDGEIIVIPIQIGDSRIECINPKYITDVDLINEHTGLMNKLINELKNQEEILKINKYGKKD